MATRTDHIGRFRESAGPFTALVGIPHEERLHRPAAAP